MSINLASSQSSIVTDSLGVSHIVWADNGNIWYAVYDSNSETWENTEVIAFTGTEPVTSINFVANDKLIDGQNPGLAVVWQQGSLNDSDFFYTAGQYDNNADLQWLDTPQALTSDQVGDLEPTVTVNDSGEVIVIGSKVNFDNVANLSIKEDTDFYSQQFSVSSSQFSTSTTTITPYAPYSPQLTTDGLVNLGVLTSPTLTTQEAVQSSNESSGQGISSETQEQPGQQPVGAWNAQLSFASSLLEDWELMHSVPKDGFLRTIINPFMKNWEIVGTISGGQNFGWGNSPPSIFLQTNAQLEWKSSKTLGVPWRVNELNVRAAQRQNFDISKVTPDQLRKTQSKSPITFGFDLDSRYDFAPNSPYDLINIDDKLSLSASVKFPIISPLETAGFFSLDATGSLGINFNFLGETIAGQTYSPQTLGGALSVIGANAFVDTALLAITYQDKEALAGVIAADIAFNVADTIVAFINGTVEGLDPKGSISFPVLSTGLVGKAQIPHVPILSADINGGVTTAFNWGIGNTDNTISLNFPIGFEVKVGPLGFGFNFNPGWYWDVFDGNKDSTSNVSAETASSLATTSQAQISGSLLTIELDSTISTLPNPDDFIVTVTDINGNNTPIPVFNVIQGNSPTTIVLQLESSIATSENLDYTTSNNPTPSSNTVSLSFTNNEGITDSEGTVIENFSDLNVTNATPNTLNYTYNPTSGNSQNYTKPTLLLAFNTPLDTNVNPDVDRFSVTSGNTQLSITNAQVTNNGVLLTFASSVTNQSLQNVTISYNNNTSLGSNPLKDNNGGSIESFTIQNGLTTGVSQSFVVINNTNDSLNLSNTATDYSVTVTNSDGTIVDNIVVQTVSITGDNVTLNLNQNISPDQILSISYNSQNITNSLVIGITPSAVSTQSLMANIEADLGQDSSPVIISGGSSSLLAWVAEVPPLEPIAGFVNGDVITLYFLENLNSNYIPPKNQFTVTDNEGNTYNIDSNPSISNNSLTFDLLLDSDQTLPEEVYISYNLSSASSNIVLQNNNTNLLVNEFSDFSISNITNNNSAPALLGAGLIATTIDNNTVVINKITLVFDQALTGNPFTSQFTVISNGVEFPLQNEPDVVGNTVILNVTAPNGSNLIGAGDIVTVNYSNSNVPSEQQLTNSNNGEIVASFATPQPVITSPSTPTTVIKYALLDSSDSNLVSNISSIPGTGGFNFNPVGAYDSSNNVTVLVWSNADSSDINTNLVPGEFYTDNQTSLINESFNQSDIYYSIYNPSTQSWTVASPIAQQEGSEGKIVIGEWVNNQLMTAWINYNNGESTIYWSSLTYNNGVASWSNPEILYADANPDPLTELRIVTIDGKPTVLWTETQGTSYSQLTLEESPLLYYRLAQTSGTSLVNEGIYGAGGNGTYNGSVTFNEVGALEDTTTNQGDANPAVLFNSGNSATSSTIPLSGTSFSVEFWFKVPSVPSDTLTLVTVIGLMTVSLDNRGVSLNINNTPLNSEGFTPSANEWNYVVATYNGENNTANLYVNGDNVGSLDSVYSTIPSNTNTSLLLASSSNNSSVYLDEVAFYRQALTYNDTPDISDFGNLTSSQIAQLLLNTSQIGNKYNSQYIAPLPSGANTNYVSYDSNFWSSPSVINPTYKPIATQLSDANNAQWDVTSFTSANSGGYVNPNGNPDIYLNLNPLTNQTTGTKISSIEVTANNVTWSVGNTNGNQLAVVQGDKLLNPVNPDGSFDYTILSPSVDFDLFLDAGSNSFPSGTTFNVTINYSNGSTTTQTLQAGDVTSEPTDINSNQVLGIATVTEANDSSLALIDSGFIINTNNPSIGYSIVSADFNNDNKSDVAVGNRGYTNTSGTALGGGTIQILFGGDAVLSNNETNPLTTTDLTGNPNGVLITGLSDTGQANGDYPFSMATGDVNGDGYEDLVIGDPNANQVYVIYGSEMTAGTTIDVTNLGSQGYVINAPNPNIGFGYSVAVGNFNSNAQSNGTYASGTKFDIAIGSPGANNGNGAVYVAFDGTSNLSTIYNPTNYQLTLTPEGSLVLLSSSGEQVWTATNNDGQQVTGAVQALMQTDGNFVLYSQVQPTNKPGSEDFILWQTGTTNNNSTTNLLQLATDGGLYIKNSNGDILVTLNQGNSNINNVGRLNEQQQLLVNDSLFPRGELAGYSLAVSSRTSQAVTFTGNKNSDDLIIGSIDYEGTVTNQWTGLNGLPTNTNQNNNYPSTSTAEIGAVYVYKSNGTTSNTFNTTPYVTYTGPNLPSSNGTANSINAGSGLNSSDLNGDGINDLAISAPGSGNNNGAVYVLDGGVSTNSNPQNLGNVANLSIIGGLSFSQTGAIITSPGDVNNDGYEDFLITAPQGANGTGQGYVLFGPLNLSDIGTIFDLNVTASDSKTTFLLNGDQPYQLVGSGASGIGDVNGDGVDDLMISAPNAGQLYTIFGHPWLADDGSIKLADISADNGFVIDGMLYSSANDGASLMGNGNNVVMLGDVNGDGFSDVLSGGSANGGVLIFGNSTTNLIDAAVGTDDIVIKVNNQTIREFVALGDINGDGLQDLGVIDNNNNFYVQLGSRTLPTLGSSISLSNPLQTSIINGFAVGDYNGDGYGDVVLRSSDGVWTLYHGSSSGSLNSTTTTFSGLTGNGLGDINGDGYSDVGLGNENINLVSPNAIANGQFTVSLGDNQGNSTINPPDAVFEQDLINSEWTSQYSFSGQSAELAPTLVEFNGYLYMLYNATDSVGGNNNTLWIQRSADGVNWEGLTNLGSSFETDYQASLAVFDNTLYLAFTATDNELILASAVSADTDLGLTFSGGDFYQIPGQSSQQGPTLVTYNDELYAFFLANNSNNSILYLTSDNPNSSSSWSSNSNVPYSGGNNSSSDRIGATVFNDELYIAFKASNSDSISVTSYNGSTWLSANSPASSQVISGQNTTAGPSLIATDETLYLFYKSSISDESIYYTYGDNWDNVEYIPNQSSFDRTTPAFFNQSIYIAHVGYNNDTSIYVTASNPIFEPNQTQQLGSQLQGIGDFNGDGIEDYGVLAPGYATFGAFSGSNFNHNQGALFIYYGSNSGTINDNPNVVLNPQYSSTNSTIYNLSNFTAIGDINGDGYDDVAIASPTTNSNEGTVFVVFGDQNWGSTYSATNPFDLNSLSNNQSNSNTDNSNANGFLITGLTASQAGMSLSGGEDVNGDSFDDFVIGAPGNNDNLSYVIFGSDFNHTVTQTGTIGDDVMIGTATGESFLAGEGDDQIFTNGGFDVVYAGLGDDFVTVNDTYFRRLDGGAGTDVLRFEGYNKQDWNLTTLSPGNRLRNFEILVTEGYGANTLTLNSLTVTQLSPTNTVTVVMDAQDTLNLSSDFTLNGTVYQYNQKFDRYTSNISSATVLLNRIVETETETSQLVLTEEGSLVLLSSSGEQLWTAEKNGVQVTGAVQALMQNDGNFVLYSQVQPTNQPGLAEFALWASGTNNNDSGTYLQLGTDGGLYIKNSTGQILSTLNSGNANISNPSRLNEQQELLSNDSLTATLTETTNSIDVTKNAPSTNTPTSNSIAEVASVSAETMTSYSIDESGNSTAQSFASSVFSATASNPNAPTRLSVSNPTANEADGEVEFTIQRTGDLDKYVQVHYLTQDGRGKAGSDYNPVLGRAVFAPGETTKTVAVPLILDDIHTGTRDLGLLVTLEKESDTIINDEFHLNIDPSNGQIRNWNHIIGEQSNSVMGGELEFRVTTTDGKAQVKVYFEGSQDFNSYYIFNNETQQYEAFSGAQLFDEDGDGKNEGAILNLQDGSEYDLDGGENGIMFKRGFFAFGDSPEIVLDTAMYRFRSLQTEGA